MNKHVKIFITLFTVLLTLIGFSVQESQAKLGNLLKSKKSGSVLKTGSDKAFYENKDNLTNSYDYLKKFTGTRSRKEQIAMAGDVPAAIKLAEKTVKNLESGISEGLSKYEKRNKDAKKIRLKGTVSRLKSYIKKSKSSLDGCKKQILKSIKLDVEWFNHSAAKPQIAPKVMTKIENNFKTLDKFAKNDSKVKQAKKKYLPQAKKNYKKLMAKVGSNRMAKAKYKKGDKKLVENQLKKAYKQRYSSAKVARVVITSPSWTKKTIIVDDNQKAYFATYMYISAQVAENKGKLCKVYNVTFRKPASGGTVRYYSAGSNFPVYTSNINK